MEPKGTTRGAPWGRDDLKWAARRLALPLAAIVAVGATMALGGSKPSIGDLKVGPIEVHAAPLASFDRQDPKKTRFGRLTWRGGLVLTSPSPNFGGWSGLALDADGAGLLAISDAGAWMTGRLVYAGGKPKGLDGVRVGPLKSESGRTFARYRDRDAEGLALLDGELGRGRVLISFERNHRIVRFDIDNKGLSAARGSVALPKLKKPLTANTGFEAIAVLQGPNKGALVAFPETLRDRVGDHMGWLWVDDEPRAFQLAGDDFDVTDAAGLPDGGLLVLERRFRWNEGVKIRLRRIGHQELRPAARIEGETLLEAGMEQEIDNMEGLSVHAGANGEIIVTMISDDNFNHALQRTVLLQFALDPVDRASAGAQP